MTTARPRTIARHSKVATVKEHADESKCCVLTFNVAREELARGGPAHEERGPLVPSPRGRRRDLERPCIV